MASEFLKVRSIKYNGKDFQGLKRNLMDFSEAHHSGAFQDFNESSPGMAALELAAYVGDVLSFYQDRQFEELKDETARQIENVTAFAKQRGYRPQGKRAAQGTVTFFLEVPSTTLNGKIVPDDTYAPILRMGARVQGPNSTLFETLDDVNFSASDGRMVTGSRFDSNTGLPTHFAIRKDVSITAGETVTESFVISEFQQFREIELTNEDVLEVISVTDSESNTWYEVNHLAEESVFDTMANTDDDSPAVPYVLKLLTVPRRFITDRDPLTRKTKLIFGSGDGVNFDDEIVPNLADLSLPIQGRPVFSSYPLDPQNFLKTRSLGLSPFNTTITVTYRRGGGSETNVPPKSIKTVVLASMDFSTNQLDTAKRGAVEGSIECINMKKTEGGGSPETISEIKANAGAFFATQDRVVTRDDYIARVKSLPAKFGKPEKTYVKINNANGDAIDMHLLAKDENGYLCQASPTLKKNIKTYLSKYRMMTDGLNLLNGDIINLRCRFGIVVSPKINRSEVLIKCLVTARDYLSTDRMEIGQPIVISDLKAEIQKVYGVISVYSLEFSNVVGTVSALPYSVSSFNVKANTRDEIIYCPAGSIFELKYPTIDITGVTK